MEGIQCESFVSYKLEGWSVCTSLCVLVGLCACVCVYVIVKEGQWVLSYCFVWLEMVPVSLARVYEGFRMCNMERG